MKDLFDRKINYLRVSVTDRCNMRCRYCMPADGIHKLPHDQIMRNEEIIHVIREMAALGINKVRLTGGEPMTRRGIVEMVREIKRIPGITDLAMTTNGFLLDENLDRLVDAGLDRLNISLDTLDPDKYREITRGGELAPVLKVIERAADSGIRKVKINAVLIGGFNVDEIGSLAAFAKDKPIDVRFIELMPIGEAADWSSEMFVSNDLVLQRLKGLEPVDYYDLSSPARYYRIPGYQGLIGLINPVSCNFCAHCNRIRLTADGKLKPCLHSNEEIELLSVLRSHPEKVAETIRKSVQAKPESHHINEATFKPITRNMNKIGG